MIGKIGVIGAGNMGSGIVQKAAQEGIHAVMIDTEDRFVEAGMRRIRDTLAAAVERRIFTPEQTQGFMTRITGTTELEEVKDADLIIEAIFEDMDVKKELFRNLDSLCDQKTILASNTSSFSITELASSVERKDHFLGLHFFYHPAKNRLLEIIPGEGTSHATLSLAKEFSRTIGKIAIDIKDAPGFAVNRFFVPWLNEAARLLDEGVNIPTIDEVAKRSFGIGMGPFELMNVTGVPIAFHSTVSLGNELGDFYGPCDRLREQFETGEPWSIEGEVDHGQDVRSMIERRLVGAVFTIACQLVEEGVASIEDTDRGAKVGLRWKHGPFEMMNHRGINESYRIVSDFVERYPDLEIPELLHRQYGSREPWPISYVDLRVEAGIAWILFNRPEAMNAINEVVMQQLDERFSAVEKDPEVRTIVLEGAGKAFVAGADIEYFIRKIEEDRIPDIVEFTRFGHSVLARIDNSEKLVIARLHGIALGGGAEIALAADTIVASEKASIGFPETGIGIYPGLGGTQRTTRYIGRELAKYLIFTGKVVDVKKAASMGLVEYVVAGSEIDGKIKELANAVNAKDVLRKSERRAVSRDLPDDFVKIRDHFSDENIGRILTNADDLDEFGKKLAKTISFKAPIALRLANTLIEEGGAVGLEEGLRMEIDHLTEIFSTKDAYEGLSSVVERRRPVFTGE